MGLRNISLGSRGPDVFAVQQGLNKYYGRHVLDEDGAFGSNTDRVVRQFQDEKGMRPPDGIVGPITRSALFPLVAVTTNFWFTRNQAGADAADSAAPGAGTGGQQSPHLILGFGIPGVLPLPIPPGLLTALATNEVVQPPGATEALPTPAVTTPPGGRIVVDWQQIMQSQRQFDGLFRNQQDSFAIGWQSVFRRQQLDPNANHLEIATGCLLQSPIGFQDSRGNDFTIACFAQATWVESLGRSGIFSWAPYVTVQGQGNPTGPANITGSITGFPVNLQVDLSKLGFDDVSLQVGGGVIGSLRFTPDGIRNVWGPQFGVGLAGKIWFLGR
jgi:hypothetical protein